MLVEVSSYRSAYFASFWPWQSWVSSIFTLNVRCLRRAPVDLMRSSVDETTSPRLERSSLKKSAFFERYAGVRGRGGCRARPSSRFKAVSPSPSSLLDKPTSPRLCCVVVGAQLVHQRHLISILEHLCDPSFVSWPMRADPRKQRRRGSADTLALLSLPACSSLKKAVSYLFLLHHPSVSRLPRRSRPATLTGRFVSFRVPSRELNFCSEF